jgi:hypothetical protein
VEPLQILKRRYVAAALASLVCAPAEADVTPLPRAEWPTTVSAAVPFILKTLTPTQRALVAGTERDSLFLFLLLGEWGEDIETLLGLDAGNAELMAAACRARCKTEEATLELMFAAWEALRR